MKIKKIVMYTGIIMGVMFVISLGWIININKKINISDEIIPEQEITDEQLRQTVVTVYFYGKQSEKIEPEARKIDARVLLNNPYQFLINLLIEGPKNKELEKLIPDGTVLNNIEIKDEIVYIDFSDEFINEQNIGVEKEKLIINSILKTLSELNEVNGIKILINGEENKEFPDKGVEFSKIFKL